MLCRTLPSPLESRRNATKIPNASVLYKAHLCYVYMHDEPLQSHRRKEVHSRIWSMRALCISRTSLLPSLHLVHSFMSRHVKDCRRRGDGCADGPTPRQPALPVGLLLDCTCVRHGALKDRPGRTMVTAGDRIATPTSLHMYVAYDIKWRPCMRAVKGISGTVHRVLLKCGAVLHCACAHVAWTCALVPGSQDSSGRRSVTNPVAVHRQGRCPGPVEHRACSVEDTAARRYPVTTKRPCLHTSGLPPAFGTWAVRGKACCHTVNPSWQVIKCVSHAQPRHC